MIKKLLFALLILLVGTGGFGLFARQQRQDDAFDSVNIIDIEAELDQAREVLAPEPLRRTDGEPGTLTADGVLSHTNNRRIAEDLSPVTTNPVLDEAAQNKLDDMFLGQYFDHVSPSGVTPSDVVDGVGYDYIRTGENLALGNFGSDRDLVQAWMDSPGHRENILHDGFTELGVAVGQGRFEGEDIWLAVQTFAKPLSSCPNVNHELQQQTQALVASLEQDGAGLSKQRAEIDAENSSLQALATQIETLFVEGNEQIIKGNGVIQNGGTEASAQPFWDAGAVKQKEAQALEAEFKTRQATLNDKVEAFNNQIKKQNEGSAEAEELAEKVNAQIRAFNACLEQ